jgi:phosphoribosylamine--glycine ligase
MERAVLPTLHHLRGLGIDYRGVLYAGIMLTGAGPKVLEYNVRFGDPEAQVVLPRFAGDLATLLASAAAGRLDESELRFVDDAAVTVVLASEGYPEAPRTGDAISGVEDAGALPGVTVYRAGVREDEDRLLTAGGRVLDVTALGRDLREARDRAYAAVSKITWRGMHHRTDIAKEAANQ